MSMNKFFDSLSYYSPNNFVYGTTRNPLKLKNGMIIGGGIVYPEINFSLPPMTIEESTMNEVRRQYREIIDGVCKRAKELYLPGFVAEVELLPPMTINPAWGIEITKIVRDIMNEYEEEYGLKSVMRITPNDTRESERPPKMASGKYWEEMIETFRGSAEAGAELLSIESTGGKEVCDDAIINADLPAVVFSLGVMGVRDMQRLWGAIVDIADETGSIPAGDTACGFGNTAMVLADRGYVPKVFAAVVRVVTAVRSLVAYEMGAVGPSKDCAYEGPYIKAITGYPISMEGKSSACAHLSPLGNIAGAVCDLWSNESVQNIKLLGGMAPTVSLEQLAYDCRLMNTAAERGIEKAIDLRDWMVDSDSKLDPQAHILRPDVVIKLSGEIIREKSHYLRAKRAAIATIEELKRAVSEGEVLISDREASWLDRMLTQVEAMPDDEEKAWSEIKSMIDTSKFIAEDYGLE